MDYIVNECKKTGIDTVVACPEGDKIGTDCQVLHGPENDIIARYYKIAKYKEYDPVIRVCADAKHIKSELILQQLENYKKYNHICYGNFCEVFSFKQLEDYYLHDKRPQTREHVTLGMIQDMTVDWEIDLDN